MQYSIFFSPSGSSKRLVRYASKKLQAEDRALEEIDLSLRFLPEKSFGPEDFCLVAAPSFGGRLPPLASERLKKMHGQETPALALVTYGGRAYEDSLKELAMVLEKQGFRPIGAAALLCRHSIVPEIAAERPSPEDFAQLDRFLKRIQEKLDLLLASGAGKESARPAFPPLDLPGNFPYKKYSVLPMDIEAGEACVQCGICAHKCPAGAIPLENPKRTDQSKCISCMRCVYVCPFHARHAKEEKVQLLSKKLKSLYDPEKKSEFFGGESQGPLGSSR